MQTNQYDYDRRASWMPPQNQPYTGRYVASQDGGQQFTPQPQPERPVGQKPAALQKMPKAQAMALADKMKRVLAVASFIGFGAFSGLVAFHQIGSTTTTQSTQNSSGSSSSNSSNSSNSSDSSSSSDDTNSSSQSNNNFFNQQGGNTGGSSSSSSSSSSSTVSGTHTS